MVYRKVSGGGGHCYNTVIAFNLKKAMGYTGMKGVHCYNVVIAFNPKKAMGYTGR